MVILNSLYKDNHSVCPVVQLHAHNESTPLPGWRTTNNSNERVFHVFLYYMNDFYADERHNQISTALKILRLEWSINESITIKQASTWVDELQYGVFFLSSNNNLTARQAPRSSHCLSTYLITYLLTCSLVSPHIALYRPHRHALPYLAPSNQSHSKYQNYISKPLKWRYPA